MRLRKAPYWTELYYQIVEHYFWRPQAIGRRSDPSKRHPWDYWKNKLESQEVPLNHVLEFLFYIAPEHLLDRIISALLGREIINLELVVPEPGSLNYNIVQPDIIISNGNELVFVEMKVDSKSSIDQFAKYAIAAIYLIDNDPTISSVDLVILSRHTKHECLWKNSKKLGLTNEKALREMAITGIERDRSVWGERGVKRFLANNPDAAEKLAERLRTMGLHITDYATLAHILQDYATEETAVNRLIQGVLEELLRRNLVQYI